MGYAPAYSQGPLSLPDKSQDDQPDGYYAIPYFDYFRKDSKPTHSLRGIRWHLGMHGSSA